MDDDGLRAWFFREVFPHEPTLVRFLRRHWRDADEIADLRQEIYARVYRAARHELPRHAKPFLLATARNHLINEARRGRIVPIDYVADLETAPFEADDITPERHATARNELRRVQAGLDRLPPRCRDVVRMRRIDGLSTREVAERLSIAPQTVERQLMHGMRALVDFMLGGSGAIDRAPGTAPGVGKAER